MEKWEYMSVNLEWDNQANQWKVTGPWGSGLGGDNMGAALSPLGDQGWEAVGLVSDLDNASNTQNLGAPGVMTSTVVTQWQVGRIRVLLKRRKQ